MDKINQYPNALRSDLRTNLSLNTDVSENTLPFVSQSINNFSDYDISQSHDWECPSLSPHVLLGTYNKLHLYFQLSENSWYIIGFHGNNSQISDVTGGSQ